MTLLPITFDGFIALELCKELAASTGWHTRKMRARAAIVALNQELLTSIREFA